MSGYNETVVTSRMCEICGKGAGQFEFCCDCEQCFCETCKLHHLKISCLKEHRFKPLSDRIDPPSYDDVLSSSSAVASAPPEDIIFEAPEETFEYMCIECRLLLKTDIKGHLQHTILDVTGERSDQCIPVLVLLIQDSSVQRSAIDVLGRLLDKRSPSLDHAICKEEILLLSDIILTRVIKPALQREQVMEPLFLKSIGILRNFSEISKQEGEVQHLREQTELVNSLIRTLKLYVIKLGNVDSQGTANCIGTLCNLSDDIIDEREKEEIQVKSSEAVSVMSRIFSSKKKIKESSHSIKATVADPRDVTEYESLWCEPSIDLFAQIMLEASNNEIHLSTMTILMNMVPFVWHGGRNICAWLRKKKVLPVLVEILGTDEDRPVEIVRSASHLILCLIFDDENKYLIGKYAMRHMVSLLPSDETTRRTDDVVSTILSILIELSNGKDAKNCHESIMKCDGIEKIKYIKFRPQEKNELVVEEKQKASELLSILWKSEASAKRHGLTKKDVKADYVL